MVGDWTRKMDTQDEDARRNEQKAGGSFSAVACVQARGEEEQAFKVNFSVPFDAAIVNVSRLRAPTSRRRLSERCNLCRSVSYRTRQEISASNSDLLGTLRVVRFE